MNKDRYLKALADETNASVEALLSNDTPVAEAVQRPLERVVERRAAPRNINTVIRQHRTQAALFPGANPLLSRFDVEND